MKNTLAQYNAEIERCRKIFTNKMDDYGPAWRVLRVSSLTDQIFIKAQRIRSIQEKGSMAINEGVAPEFIGVINYSIIALIQIELGPSFSDSFIDNKLVMQFYDKYFEEARTLMQEKNTDYSEAWRDMRVSSLTDIILMKLFRIKQIEDNNGETKVSEGIEAGYFDIVNYAVFALIKLNEEENIQN